MTEDFSAVAAIRVSNLDSVAQRKRWNLIVRGHADSEVTGCEVSDASVPASLTDSLEFYEATQPVLLAEFEGCSSRLGYSSSLWADEELIERLLETQTALYCDLAGVLRTAFLYRPVICLTHAELFDGTFFMAIGPDRIRSLLGLSYRDSPAILVRGPGADLLESLLKFLTESDDSGRLRIRKVELSVLRVGWLQNHAIWAGAASVDLNCDDVEIPYRLAAALEQSYGLADGDLTQLGVRWAQWVRAVRNGQVLYQRNTRLLTPDAIPQALAASYVDKSIPAWARLQPEIWCRITGELKRSSVWETCEQLSAEDFISAIDDVHPITQRASYVKAIYSFGYQLALAEQHEAAWITVQDSTNEFVSDLLHRARRPGDDGPMSLSGEATRQLGAMPSTVFALTRYQARGVVAEWQEPGAGRDEAKAVAYAIRVAQEQRNRREDLRGLIFGGILTAILAVFSVILDNTSFSGGSGVYMVPILSFVLTVLPDLPGFVREWWAMRGDAKTLIVPQ